MWIVEEVSKKRRNGIEKKYEIMVLVMMEMIEIMDQRSLSCYVQLHRRSHRARVQGMPH